MLLNKVINFNDIKAKRKTSKICTPEDEILQYMKDLFDSNLEELQEKFKKGEDENGNKKSEK